MPYTALAILIAAALLSITLARGFQLMAKTIQEAEAALISVETQLIADVSSALTAIANSISEHIANGTAAQVIQEQADKLAALDKSVEEAMAPAPVPVPTVVSGGLPDGVIGQAYAASILASGGAPGAYTFASSPPSDNGVTVNADGSVTGTPVGEADSSFAVTATDTAGTVSAPVTFTLHVPAAA